MLSILQEEPADSIPKKDLFVDEIDKLLRRRFGIELEVVIDGPSVI